MYIGHPDNEWDDSYIDKNPNNMQLLLINLIKNRLYDRLFVYQHANYENIKGDIYFVTNARPIDLYNKEKAVVYDIVFVDTFDHMTAGPLYVRFEYYNDAIKYINTKSARAIIEY